MVAKPKPEISAEEVRAVRESLGLSQVEAGELLGGGPRAFTKYEAGTIKPAASVINLLRLLEARPDAISTLTGRKSVPIATSGTGPFEVTGRHIAALTERTFAVLLRKLLTAEAKANDLPADGLHVAGSITTADAGEDGRITWTGGPDRTPYLPARLSQFQLKSVKITPSAAAGDVLTKSGAVKEMVCDALEKGGVYTMLCAHSYVQKNIVEREKRIREAIRKAGVSTTDEQVAFRDADQIAGWANCHPSAATWTLEQTQPGLTGPFRSWNHWAGRAEHDGSPWVEDERLPGLRAQLRGVASVPRAVARVVGPSGVGKSRLTLEALGSDDEDESSGLFLSDTVLYAVETEAGSVAIKNVVQNLADTGMRATVVVDRCFSETHQDLAGMVSRKSSRLSLITIDDEIPTGPLGNTTFKVDEAPTQVTEAIINQVSPGLMAEDQRRLVRFSKGFPKIAIVVGQSWNEEVPLAHATDDALVDGVVLGRKPREPDMVRKAAALLATFGLVGVRAPADGQLGEIASLGRGLTEADLRVSFEELVRRGVAQRRGRAVILQPRPIALRLAERQWREWSPANWDRVLAGETSPNLKIMAARQLALLNTTDTANEVVQHVCRFGGPLDGLKGISQTDHSEVLSALAEISTEIVAHLIERSLHDADLTTVAGDVRRHLVWALEKIAFDPITFEDGARLLLRLAVNENESWGNNASGQFKSLFSVLLGDTAAGHEARLAMLDEAADTDDPVQQVIAAEALIAGAKTDHFTRGVGPEIHGTRPALEPWRPETWGEAWAYVKACVERLATLAQHDNEAGARVRTGLGHDLRSLVRSGLIDTVERVVRQVCAARGNFWPEALESLGDVLVHDSEGLEDDLLARVRTLIAELQPDSFEDRLRFLVTEMPWDYPCDENLDFDERGKRQVEVVRDLAAELVAKPERLTGFLPQLSHGRQRMVSPFGQAIAELADKPLDWLTPIETATAEAPDGERNYDLLAGYLVGIAKTAPEVVDAFKQDAATSPLFAPALPLVCWRLGIVESDIPLIISALESRLLPPWRLNQWTGGGVLAKVQVSAVAPFFDVMFDLNAEAYAVGLDLLGMYAHNDLDRLNGLRPQVLKAAENVAKWPRSRVSQMDAHHFQRVIEWMLKKGRDDAGARATALTLARTLVAAVESQNEGLVEPVLPMLLADFPEIAWPLIGQAIVSDRRGAWRFEHVLGDTFSSREQKDPAILMLPEDTLFAWCHAHPDTAPAFVAAIVPVLTTRDAEASDRELHPITRRLLKEFGDRDEVLQGLSRNMHTFSWWGSRTTYYALYQVPFAELLNHPIAKVRRWTKQALRQLSTNIEDARNEDEEREARWEV